MHAADNFISMTPTTAQPPAQQAPQQEAPQQQAPTPPRAPPPADTAMNYQSRAGASPSLIQVLVARAVVAVRRCVLYSTRRELICHPSALPVALHRFNLTFGFDAYRQ
jgi:hypothetical protein